MDTILFLAQHAGGTGGGGGLGGIGIGYWIIIGGTMLSSMLVSNRMKSKFAKYSQEPIGLSGREVAERMLADNGINNVKVTSVAGQLTDHYNPANKTVNLSESVYNMRSVASAAVAAHECGHAVQHAQAYTWLAMRSKMVPAVNVATKMMNVVFMVMMFGMFASGNGIFMMVYLACLAATTLFAFVTLPVEFDASNRALAWLDNSGSLGSSIGHSRAKDALFWAAMTYVVAALSSLAMLLYFLLRFMGNRR
jgi:Zn-dependent membrane protease YugP